MSGDKDTLKSRSNSMTFESWKIDMLKFNRELFYFLKKSKD